MGKWQLGTVAGFLLIYCATVLITGNAAYVIPAVILAVLILIYALVNRGISKTIVDKHHHGDVEEAMADENEIGLPAAHLVADDDRPVGDTPEAHDELNPHDLPLGHPGREAAEEQAGGEAGATTGNREGAAGGAADTAADSTAERTG